MLLSVETGGVSDDAKCGTNSVSELSPDSVKCWYQGAADTQELLGGGESIPFSLSTVSSESSSKVFREEQTRGSFKIFPSVITPCHAFEMSAQEVKCPCFLSHPQQSIL